ncbi:MAG: RNA polymerase sporulation sigma factor SigH [Lachnospiraceae bacterium]|nr:RNA polymerase sporulation sigma factor SigH [Lachnospiraceae bacterium]
MKEKSYDVFENKYSERSDEYVLSLAKNGDTNAQDYILDKYKYIVKTKSRVYFLIGADVEDIIQEGMIGLYKAIRDFQADRNVSFRAFAELCIQRQMITAIKAATRQKHIPLNSYISINKPAFEEDGGGEFLEVLCKEDIHNPEDIVIGQEEKLLIESNIIKVLSKFESEVLFLYLQGRSYDEISKLINKPQKSVDNALQRIKKKVEGLMYKKSKTK